MIGGIYLSGTLGRKGRRQGGEGDRETIRERERASKGSKMLTIIKVG